MCWMFPFRTDSVLLATVSERGRSQRPSSTLGCQNLRDSRRNPVIQSGAVSTGNNTSRIDVTLANSLPHRHRLVSVSSFRFSSKHVRASGWALDGCGGFHEKPSMHCALPQRGPNPPRRIESRGQRYHTAPPRWDLVQPHGLHPPAPSIPPSRTT